MSTEPADQPPRHRHSTHVCDPIHQPGARRCGGCKAPDKSTVDEARLRREYFEPAPPRPVSPGKFVIILLIVTVIDFVPPAWIEALHGWAAELPAAFRALAHCGDGLLRGWIVALGVWGAEVPSLAEVLGSARGFAYDAWGSGGWLLRILLGPPVFGLERCASFAGVVLLRASEALAHYHQSIVVSPPWPAHFDAAQWGLGLQRKARMSGTARAWAQTWLGIASVEPLGVGERWWFPLDYMSETVSGYAVHCKSGFCRWLLGDSA